MSTQQGLGDAALQMALRGLHRDIAPTRDLWPGIAARMQVPVRSQAHRQTRAWPWTLAASLLLAAGLGWHAGAPLAPSPTVRAVAVTPLPRDVQLLNLHYQNALRELQGQTAAASWQPGLQALDRGATQVLSALHRAPDSPQLREQLRQIYARRLALSRRALFA